MRAVPGVRGALPHFEVVRTCSIAVAAAWTAGAPVVNPQVDSAQRTRAFDHIADGCLSLVAQRLRHVEKVTRGLSAVRVGRRRGRIARCDT
jgi:hypothetical protein